MDSAVGASESRSVTDSPETNAALAASRNQLQIDKAFLSRTRFKRMIATRRIVTGRLHALVAMDLPGCGSFFVNQTWSFPKPIYIDDATTATGIATSPRPSRGFYR